MRRWMLIEQGPPDFMVVGFQTFPNTAGIDVIDPPLGVNPSPELIEFAEDGPIYGSTGIVIDNQNFRCWRIDLRKFRAQLPSTKTLVFDLYSNLNRETLVYLFDDWHYGGEIINIQAEANASAAAVFPYKNETARRIEEYGFLRRYFSGQGYRRMIRHKVDVRSGQSSITLFNSSPF